ncbi:hypothetical protein AA0113_g8722 [Alternaria arborescens]|uniref:Fumarylacetoacetase-like C-terminal domain-containing protein n=2 Tax=Alternaria arborescens TaxID=156630 RepID=A0A4Q4RGN5_9PLEO|nr:hypothetical protein AA0113_g8722 [Alternaria arborescens]
MAPFKHLVRFQNASSKVFYGELQTVDDFDTTLIGQTVRVFNGDGPWDTIFRLSDQEECIAEVLCPLPSVPLFVCIGLNYRQHANEAGMAITPYPVVFMKPPDALAGPFEDVHINAECKMMDYEAELCFVIGKDCKNVTESEDAMQYILGYTAGNDVSSRYWQAPERSGNQHGSAKSFDKFAPVGPVITSRDIIPNPHKLKIKSFF